MLNLPDCIFPPKHMTNLGGGVMTPPYKRLFSKGANYGKKEARTG